MLFRSWPIQNRTEPPVCRKRTQTDPGEIDDDPRDGGDPPSGAGPYVEDQYFDASTDRRQRRLLDDPTPELKDQQDHIFIRHVVDGGLEDSDFDVIEYLVSDGGRAAPKEIAEERGWHIDTIYRAIDRLEDLVEHNYAGLSLRSHHIAQRLTEAVQHAREDIEDAATTLAKRLESRVGLELANDALLEWVDALGLDVEDRRDAQLALRFGRVHETKDDFVVTLTNGLYDWMRAGWERERFLNAEVHVELKDRTYHGTPAKALLS